MKNTVLRAGLRMFNVFLCNLIALVIFTRFLDFSVSKAVFLALIGGAVVSVLVLEVEKHPVPMVLGYCGAVIVFGLLSYRRLAAGSMWLAENFFDLVNKRLNTAWEISSSGSAEADRDILLIYVIAWMSLLLASAYKKKRFVFLWVALATATLYVSLAINSFPDAQIVIAFCAMLIYLRITLVWERMEDGRIHIYELALLTGLMLFGAVTLTVISPEIHKRSVNKGVVRKHVRVFNEKTVNRVMDKIDKLLNGKPTNSAGMAGGHLTSDGLNYTNKTHLIVTLPKNSPSTYLRGYVGDNYVLRRWYPPQNYGSALPVDSSLLWLHDDDHHDVYNESAASGITGQDFELLHEAVFALYDSIYRNRLRFPLYQATMRVERVGATKEYVYVPYGVSAVFDSAAFLNQETDGAWIPNDDRWEYLFVYLYNEKGLPNYYSLATAAKWKAESVFTAEEGKKDIPKMYERINAVVRQRNLTVPDEIEELLDGMLTASAYRLSETDEIVAYVQQFMERNFSYTTDPPKNRKDEDPLIFFIRDSKQGYCMHYASTAVMLFRMLGVPARYAEGYLIKGQEIAGGKPAENEGRYGGMKADKDQLELLSGYVTVEVKDSSAHAWVEIWLDDYGWFPIEVTYSSSTDMSYLRRELEREKNLTPTPTQGERPTGAVTKTPAATKTPTPKGGKKEATKQETKTVWDRLRDSAFWILPALLLLVVAFFIIRYYVITLNRTRRFLAKDPNKATLAVYKEIIVLAGYLGIHREPQEMDREFHERLFRELPKFSEDISMENAANLTERAAFSEEGVSTSDKLLVKRYYHRLRRECLARRKNPGRWFWQIYRGI